MGLTPDDERGTSALRTFGCNAFGLKEIERRRIARRLRDETQFLYAVARWVIENHVELKGGDTCGYTRDEYRSITEAPSVFFQNDLVLVLGDDDPPDPTTGKKPSARRVRRAKGTHHQIALPNTAAKKRSRG